ncbi:hypothetical protein SPAR54_1010 [Streptococcus pneumoniae GA18523]|nr:hypothetical protein SPAR5_1404 [Streptococcus pneumoniae GA04375]EHD36829.1 hypothetical protein SPAR90_1423 [Streptococcus pneumoniae GA47281]EHD45359.1 hypothetical protein SPAR110_1442 [Streptococcus pneumoniae GA49138]EHD71303.1 hypothetical protein SPAR54_1010 [Streptococcus pneumoniae GA18523]EHD96968.1 hypothetical protein SPAR38_1451 [Streptococcus pneumoniae GA16121]EHE04437.1 hypothetical protein SPAR41_1597 [Streptococcus pneumoniae GA16833]EHE58357.1 hypothetical protein SPAR1
MFYYTTLGLFSQLFFPKNQKTHFLFLKDNFSYFDAKKGISFKFS